MKLTEDVVAAAAEYEQNISRNLSVYANAEAGYQLDRRDWEAQLMAGLRVRW